MSTSIREFPEPLMRRGIALVIVAFSILASSNASTALHPQNPPTSDGVVGTWEWKGPWNKRHARRTFWLRLSRDGNSVQGAYSVTDWLADEPLIADGNQTPFRGRIEKGVVHVEFDPTDLHPGYESDVRYTPPTDGRHPSLATITSVRGRLVWQLQAGAPVGGVPRRMILKPFRP